MQEHRAGHLAHEASASFSQHSSHVFPGGQGPCGHWGGGRMLMHAPAGEGPPARGQTGA